MRTVLIIVAVIIVWKLVMKGFAMLGVSDKPKGNTMDEKYADVCRKAQFTPDAGQPLFISKFSNLVLSSMYVIYSNLGNDGVRRNVVIKIEDITSIDTTRGYEKRAGDVAWGTLIIHCFDGRESRLSIPADEIETFMKHYNEAKADMDEFIAYCESGAEEQ